MAHVQVLERLLEGRVAELEQEGHELKARYAVSGATAIQVPPGLLTLTHPVQHTEEPAADAAEASPGDASGHGGPAGDASPPCPRPSSSGTSGG